MSEYIEVSFRISNIFSLIPEKLDVVRINYVNHLVIEVINMADTDMYNGLKVMNMETGDISEIVNMGNVIILKKYRGNLTVNQIAQISIIEEVMKVQCVGISDFIVDNILEAVDAEIGVT